MTPDQIMVIVLLTCFIMIYEYHNVRIFLSRARNGWENICKSWGFGGKK